MTATRAATVILASAALLSALVALLTVWLLLRDPLGAARMVGRYVQS